MSRTWIWDPPSYSMSYSCLEVPVNITDMLKMPFLSNPMNAKVAVLIAFEGLFEDLSDPNVTLLGKKRQHVKVLFTSN